MSTCSVLSSASEKSPIIAAHSKIFKQPPYLMLFKPKCILFWEKIHSDEHWDNVFFVAKLILGSPPLLSTSLSLSLPSFLFNQSWFIIILGSSLHTYTLLVSSPQSCPLPHLDHETIAQQTDRLEACMSGRRRPWKEHSMGSDSTWCCQHTFGSDGWHNSAYDL